MRFKSQRTRARANKTPLPRHPDQARPRESGSVVVFVVGVPNIPRKPNGKIDSDNLPRLPQWSAAGPKTAETVSERPASRRFEPAARPGNRAGLVAAW